ncbi:LOW QUALITY PROTEIN: pyroglutamyl-peptidase 1-like protein [Strix aluco]|uniref:LOW QUALITY PROTEIN: pyroglutamyl-peptidase 1-like protein n=1 Tax=Strix aluco TaxID=111821 RepID=UPI003DA2EAA3
MKNIAGYFAKSFFKTFLFFLGTIACLKKGKEAWGSPSQSASVRLLFLIQRCFGPFRQYLVNSSWEAVKELSKRGLGKNIDLHIMQLPVVYQKAKEQVFKIWTTLHPLLTVHVGLASSAKALIILEQCGKNKGYQEMDACGLHPEGGCCMLDGPEKIESTINMKSLWKNISVEGIDIIFSRDAGRYICDYTYYTSLYYGNGRAAFIHVPPLSKSVTAEFLGKALQTIILEMLKQCGKERE